MSRNRNLYSTVGQSTPDNLVGDNLVFQKRVEVTINAAGEYKRGQLLMVNAEGVASLPTAAAITVDAVLLTDVGEVTAEDVPVLAAASMTGEFNENVVEWGAIPEASRAAVVRNVKDKQLYIAPMHQAPFVQFGEVQ